MLKTMHLVMTIQRGTETRNYAPFDDDYKKYVFPDSKKMFQV